MAGERAPPIVLFGYDSSPFTSKIKLTLRLRQIPYTFVVVPSMMPRHILVSNFGLTYRKIPVMAIGKEIYIDTSLIMEALAEHPSYPPSPSHPPIHHTPATRTLTRLLSSHYTDRPLFRLTTGTIPQSVWETSFATDRAGLIGHPLDPGKLGAKIPRNRAALATYLGVLEPLFATQTWFLDTPGPSGADISLFIQLDWARRISRGEGVGDLTAGGTADGAASGTGAGAEGIEQVFNPTRCPGLVAWFDRMAAHAEEQLPARETRVERDDRRTVEHVMSVLDACEQAGPVPLLPTSGNYAGDLDERVGLVTGARVSVAPDDTGRDDPTLGTLVGLSAEEVVIVPDVIEGRTARVGGVRVHFPRVGFVVKPLGLADREQAEIRITVTTKSRL